MICYWVCWFSAFLQYAPALFYSIETRLGLQGSNPCFAALSYLICCGDIPATIPALQLGNN